VSSMPETGRRAGARSQRLLAWAVIGLIVVLIPLNLLLAELTDSWRLVVQAVPFLTFPVVGAVLAIKRPSNPLGWLMLGIGLVWVLPLEGFAEYALTVEHGSIPGGAYALAFASPGWVPFIGLTGYMLLLFPDGRVPSPRWRWFACACGVGLTLLFLLILFAPGRFTDYGYSNVANPFGIEALRPLLSPLLVLVAFAPLIILGGAAGVVVRMRRAHDDVERHQLRWLAWTAGTVCGLYLIGFIPIVASSAWSTVLGNIAITGFALIPVAIGIAVLRYRLYDIDLVIRKTVIVGSIAVFFTLVFVAVVGGIGALVQSRSSTALSFLAAAIVAALFQPVLVRVRRLADRIVYGRRATPYELVAEFGRHLGGTYDANDVLPRIARVLGEGIGAASARVRLRVGDELRQLATWPPDAPTSQPDDLSVDVTHDGEMLGALAVAMPSNDPLNATKTNLVHDLAAQAGLVLRNVRLVEELRASQRRIVAAQDHERRRIERNIHDGAQQQLVALSVKARLARSLVERDPAKAAQMLDEIGAETQDALEDLRDLARGIYPPLLADKGLVAALESQARKVSMPVEISPEAVERYPQAVEAAVYFSILEALQNVAKYAEASSVSVRLEDTAGRLRFEVRDDGLGFNPSLNGYGTGLQGIADRLAALGGALEVRAAPGRGTTVAGAVPIG
jgi:signal transduction histidine kinase